MEKSGLRCKHLGGSDFSIVNLGWVDCQCIYFANNVYRYKKLEKIPVYDWKVVVFKSWFLQSAPRKYQLVPYLAHSVGAANSHFHYLVAVINVTLVV